jgi:hypothetical protein
MKVVCVRIPFTFIGKSVNIKVEVGEIFDAKCMYSNEGTSTGYWYIKDRLGNVIPCDLTDTVSTGKYFIELQEYRNMKIQELGI